MQRTILSLFGVINSCFMVSNSVYLEDFIRFLPIEKSVGMFYILAYFKYIRTFQNSQLVHFGLIWYVCVCVANIPTETISIWGEGKGGYLTPPPSTDTPLFKWNNIFYHHFLYRSRAVEF